MLQSTSFKGANARQLDVAHVLSIGAIGPNGPNALASKTTKGEQVAQIAKLRQQICTITLNNAVAINCLGMSERTTITLMS